MNTIAIALIIFIVALTLISFLAINDAYDKGYKQGKKDGLLVGAIEKFLDTNKKSKALHE